MEDINFNSIKTILPNQRTSKMRCWLFLLFFFSLSNLYFAQNIPVTFKADMSIEIADRRFNPGTDTLTVRGNFNSWNGNTILKRTDDITIYAVTINRSVIEGETWNYKYAYITKAGINWEGDPNKTYTFTKEDIDNDSAVIGPRRFNDMSCRLQLEDTVDALFQVNMKNAKSAVTGNSFSNLENVMLKIVHWGFWPQDSTITLFMNDEGKSGDLIAGDSIWSVKLTFPAFTDAFIQYKYTANYDLSSNTGSNENEAPKGEYHYTILGGCSYPGYRTEKVSDKFGIMGRTDAVEIKYTNVPVTFKVDMNAAVALNEFSSSDIVAVTGNFTNWGTEPFKLTDPDNDLIYTGTLDTFDINDTLVFKFAVINSVSNSNVSWENNNREYFVTGSNDIYEAYWNNLPPGEVKNIIITFIADMECEIKAGRFNPATDTLTVRGYFNNWGSKDILHQSESDSNKFKIDINYNAIPGSVINYKYAYMTKNGVNWESDPNKEYTITQEDYDKGSAEVLRTFNNIGCLPILMQNPNITFQVNMNDAVSSVTGNPFDKIENVIITGAMPPLIWPGTGWPTEDSIGIFHLNDNGIEGDSLAGDNIWSTTVTFPKYSPLRVQYKYGANWGLPSNTGSNDNENNSGTDHFINLEENLISAKVMNIWGVMGDTTIYDKKYQTVDVKQIPTKVEKYSLEQNYPNPFNPSTKISFAIPEAGIVSLKVYNILGQEVKNLINEFKSSGRYEVNFDASNLSTGTYIYRISVNDFSVTKKMMLVK